MYHYSNEGSEKNEFQGHFFKSQKGPLRLFCRLNKSVSAVFGDGMVGGGGVVWFKSKETCFKLWVNL